MSLERAVGWGLKAGGPKDAGVTADTPVTHWVQLEMSATRWIAKPPASSVQPSAPSRMSGATPRPLGRRLIWTRESSGTLTQDGRGSTTAGAAPPHPRVLESGDFADCSTTSRNLRFVRRCWRGVRGVRGGALQQQRNSPAEPQRNLLVPATPGCDSAGQSRHSQGPWRLRRASSIASSSALAGRRTTSSNQLSAAGQ